MGVSKAALESLARYLARDLGAERIRVNLVAAGPVKTMAAKSIPGFTAFEDTWAERAPLGWDVFDTDVVARACVALLSRPAADDHRRDPPRRRRRPRHGGLTLAHRDPARAPDELRRPSTHYVATINGRDPEAIADLFTEDAVQADPASNPPNVGRQAIAAFFTDGIAASEGWVFEAERRPHLRIDRGHRLHHHRRPRGRLDGHPGIEVFESADDGRFSSAHAYWDDADVAFA